MCQHHYDKARRSGQLAPAHKPSVEERFWSRVVRPNDADQCWKWTGSHIKRGYGTLYVDGRMRYVHRLAYEMHVGPIGTGLELDHLCRNVGCLNPRHLEPVTHRENLLRGDTITAHNAAATECPRGHPYDADNTYMPPSGGRRCRRCAYERNLAVQQGSRAA